MRTLVNIGMINDRRAVIREVKRSVGSCAYTDVM